MSHICSKCFENSNGCKCPVEDETEIAEEQEQSLTLLDYMSMCSYAVEISEQVNPMTKAEEDRKRKIQRKALRIAELIIDEIYESMGDKED